LHLIFSQCKHWFIFSVPIYILRITVSHSQFICILFHHLLHQVATAECCGNFMSMLGPLDCFVLKLGESMGEMNGQTDAWVVALGQLCDISSHSMLCPNPWCHHWIVGQMPTETGAYCSIN